MNLNNQEENPAAWIEKQIKDFINTSPANTLQNEQHDKAWTAPLVGFSRGDDPLYQFYKEHIGPFHLTPEEIFTQTFPHTQITPDQLTIINWILPHMEHTKADNRKETIYPSERWARSRIFGEEVNRKLCGHLVETLRTSGHDAVAPMLSPLFEVKQSEEFGFSSTWSERHAAYASGLGTFGLSDGLITSKGKAMRCGSVIAHITIPPTDRLYHDHNEYCLFHAKGLCGRCIQRCPVGAITEAGHDKIRCEQHIIPTTAEYVRSHFGFKGYGCGLCQTNVPCESRIPTAADLSEK